MYVKKYSKIYPGVKSEDIWKIWTDVNNWEAWHDDVDYCQMEGDFKPGNYFLLKPKRANQPIKVRITEVNKGRSFTDCTDFFGAKMYDTHSMLETDNGLRLANKLVVTGPLKWLWVFLIAKDIAKSIPEELDHLVDIAKKHD